MKDSTRKYFFYLIAFVCGALATSIFFLIQKNMSLKAYASSSYRILKYDPYKYDKKMRSSIRYFYSSLPQIVQKEIEKKYSDFDYLTSCEADIIPGYYSEFVVSFFSQNKSKVLIFQLKYRDKNNLENVYDISELVDFKKKDDNDYLETYCRQSGPILRQPQFHPNEKEIPLIEDMERSNRELIQLKSRQSDTYGIFAYNPEDNQFHLVGTMPQSLPSN